MHVLSAHSANMIDSYSRLKKVAESALFYAFAEFSSKTEADVVEQIAEDLVASDMTRSVVLKGAFGAGPRLGENDLKLPLGASVREERLDEKPSKSPAAPNTAPSKSRKTGKSVRDRLGAPYYADRPGAATWTLNTAEVFMAIPFSDTYAPFYRDYVKAAVLDAGLTPVRVDELPAEAKRRTNHRADRGGCC